MCGLSLSNFDYLPLTIFLISVIVILKFNQKVIWLPQETTPALSVSLVLVKTNETVTAMFITKQQNLTKNVKMKGVLFDIKKISVF
jgi:hypothetical protein